MVDDGIEHPVADLHRHDALQAASALRLGSHVPDDVTTETLLGRAAGDVDHDLALIELAYAAGRYNIISSTGHLPATLQGVWQGTWSPAWSADYTLNGNMQNGAIASLVSTGTPELMRSVSRLLVPHLDDFRTNAKRIFGVEGALLPSRMSSHGLANHFSPAFPLQFWMGSGGWVLRMLADAVLATGDRSLVDDHSWHLVEEVLRFYQAVASQERLAPAYSPENTPLGSSTAISVDPAMDVAILRDVARSARVLAEARGVPPVEIPAVGPRYRVEGGRLAEWSFPGQADQVAHRHTSQLYALWYEADEAFTDPELRAAAAKLIHDKIAWRAENPGPPPGNMEMAFGLTQLGLAAATLGDHVALEQCVQWLARLHFTPAMTTTHDAGRLFNVDASGGLPALIAAALVQSTRDTIRLLPARPSSWTRGSVSGLTTRTGLRVVTLNWADDGVRLVLAADAVSRWVRREGVTVLLPRPATVNDGTEPVDSFRLDDSDSHTLELRWAG
ncbi:glycoside hydrolase family 95-like protein [Microbacterium sp. LWS13-1.2]|uniref:Glycosyl hydrolase family 95 N-terminal domain-containing protein n=1 Tax=Microbacterium sp. LWS13-1.2 TaxID=3135264 RepID=A0AAU6SE81_9MICO